MYRLNNFYFDQFDRLNGQIYGRRPEFLDGEYVSVSRPIKFDRVNRLLTTLTGSIYYLENAVGNKNEEIYIFNHIEEIIAQQ